MFQLKFNDNFSNIMRDIPHWNKEDDIPEAVRNFIVNTSNKRVFYEVSTGKFYCGKCAKPLDMSFYCSNCQVQHEKYSSDDIEIYDNRDITVINEITAYNSYLNTSSNYFVFNVVNQDVFLYNIEEKVSYDNPFYKTPYKSSTLHICSSSSYLVKREGLINLGTSLYIPYSTLADYERQINEGFDKYDEEVDHDIYKQCDYLLMDQNVYMYTDNLSDLKGTIYKYSRLWELSEYLKKQISLCYGNITLYPLYYPGFEYLVNYKLYSLALFSSSLLKEGKNFKEIFGVDKKCLPVMIKCNISFRELQILKLCPNIDADTLNFFSKWLGFYIDHIKELVNTYKIDLRILKDYLVKLDLSVEQIHEYFDYISMAKEVGLDLHDRKNIYPVNLRDAHDELFNQIEIISDPIIDQKLNSLSIALTFNRYEDDNYVIYPASSISDLVTESRQQKNCVRTYCEMVANNDCQIYFMRKKENITKSFVTIEVRDNKIVQARVKYNELPSEDVMRVLYKWEHMLIPITNK